MPKLRDYFQSDLNTFFNSDEHATKHNVNGEEMDIIIDNDMLKQLTERYRNQSDGVFVGDILFHVKKSDFGPRPALEQILRLDGKIYRVTDVQDDEDMYSITIARNQS